MSLGQVTPVGDNRFTLTLRDIESAKYAIEAVATDEAGSVSKSPLLELKVSNRPTARINDACKRRQFDRASEYRSKDEC